MSQRLTQILGGKSDWWIAKPLIYIVLITIFGGGVVCTWLHPAGFKSWVCTYLDVCGVKHLGVEHDHNLCTLLSDIWKDDFWNVSWRNCAEDPAETGSWCFIVWGCCSSEIGTAIYTEVYFHVPSTHDIDFLIFVGYTKKDPKSTYIKVHTYLHNLESKHFDRLWIYLGSLYYEFYRASEVQN